jgi:hypothetical protein
VERPEARQVVQADHAAHAEIGRQPGNVGRHPDAAGSQTTAQQIGTERRADRGGRAIDTDRGALGRDAAHAESGTDQPVAHAIELFRRGAVQARYVPGIAGLTRGIEQDQ